MNYSKRRENVSKALGDGSIALLFSSDNDYNAENGFDVNRNFYYLTGIDEANMVLLLENRNGYILEHLFILPFDEVEAKWIGPRMLKEEAEKISNIKDVRYLGDLDDSIKYIFDRSRAYNNINVYLDLYTRDHGKSIADDYANKLKEKYAKAIIKDIFPLLAKERLIKNEEEVDCIKEAIHITNDGIKSMMKNIKPNKLEMEMEGLFMLELNKNLCNETAFKTIAASGIRATTLHYSENNQVMKDGELFLQDLGATYKHYCADITRTYPVNGKFTDRQKEIYELVLGAQKLVEKKARPGVTIRQLNNLVIDYYKKQLPKHGLKKDVSEYYFHSISHHLGLDCHDADGGIGMKLSEGNVISNEPGLYIEDEGIGIRIEDDLLITKTGCENLSKEIIKEVKDIEEFMK